MIPAGKVERGERKRTIGEVSKADLVIDEDLGVSGSGVIERSGFARLTAEVALGHVGIVLGLEVSRLAGIAGHPAGLRVAVLHSLLLSGELGTRWCR
jgi:DNA invertase Pin-like site-specific DNA recombinase